MKKKINDLFKELVHNLLKNYLLESYECIQ